MNAETKTVLITGGSSGIGLDAARAFYARGANVVLNGRNPEKLAAADFVTGVTLNVDGGYVAGRLAA